MSGHPERSRSPGLEPAGVRDTAPLYARKKPSATRCHGMLCKSGRQDLNLRPSGPKPDALARLRHAPRVELSSFRRVRTARSRPIRRTAHTRGVPPFPRRPRALFFARRAGPAMFAARRYNAEHPAFRWFDAGAVNRRRCSVELDSMLAAAGAIGNAWSGKGLVIRDWGLD
jgi:hypothetical protein